MDASSYPKSLSISSSAPSSKPFCGVPPRPPCPPRPPPPPLKNPSNIFLRLSTAPFPLSFTRPSVVRWSDTQTQNTHLAAPAIAFPRSVGLGHVPPREQRLRDGHAVGVLEIPPHRQAARDTGDAHAAGLERLLQVRRRHLSLHRGVGRDDHLAHPRPVGDAGQQSVDA